MLIEAIVAMFDDRNDGHTRRNIEEFAVGAIYPESTEAQQYFWEKFPCKNWRQMVCL